MKDLRRPDTITWVDIVSCYDMIVHPIIISIMRHEGLSLLPLLTFFGVFFTQKTREKNPSI